MIKKALEILIIFIWLLNSACSPPTAPVAPLKNAPPAVTAPTPIQLIFRQADRVRNRLRYFAEEIKITYKPVQQAALFDDVHKIVHPAWQEIKTLMVEPMPPDQQQATNEIEQICARIDTALEERDLKLLQSALRDFNTAFERLYNLAL
ncbi:MAG: hypothetical protein AB1489_27680 [Acidobacteriota bacterium]